MSKSSIYGPNAWLIDEQFQQYSKDPNSVDKEWRDYFEANGAPKQAAQPKASAKASGSTASAPAQKPEQKKASSAAKPAEKSPAAPGAKAPSDSKSSATKPKADQKKSESPLDRIKDAPEPGSRVLKGMFKAIAKNMDESLEIPTATTVRDIPVKLM